MASPDVCSFQVQPPLFLCHPVLSCLPVIEPRSQLFPALQTCPHLSWFPTIGLLRRWASGNLESQWALEMGCGYCSWTLVPPGVGTGNVLLLLCATLDKLLSGSKSKTAEEGWVESWFSSVSQVTFAFPVSAALQMHCAHWAESWEKEHQRKQGISIQDQVSC